MEIPLTFNELDLYLIPTNDRIWDALLLFAICSRPRRDISLLDDFCATIIEYTFNLLPQSVFPFPTTIAGKQDAITEEQRVYTFDGTRGHHAIMRARKNDILSGKPTYRGHMQTGVVEDEAHMANLVAAAQGFSINVPDFPLNHWPVTLHLVPMRYYSFMPYKNALSDEERPWPHDADEITVFFNAPRNCLTVCFLDQEATEAVRQRGGIWGGNWQCPRPQIAHVLIEGFMGGFNKAMDSIFATGFGPRAMFDRCGVCVAFEDEVACVVCHSSLPVGTCKRQNCFYCPNHPFYLIDRGDAQGIMHCTPAWLDQHVVKVGAQLLLDLTCQEFQSIIRPEQLQANMEGEADPSRTGQGYDEYGNPTGTSRARDARQRSNQNDLQYLEVRLDMPNSYTPVHGKIRVTFAGIPVSSRNAVDTRSVYVQPSSLRLPGGVPEHCVLPSIMLL